MTTPETAPVEVTQADIDVGWAAWDMVRADEGNTRLRLVEVFARHRLTPRQDGLREALVVGEKFLNACNSAWAAGEPSHRVQTMLDMADEFRAALERAALSDISPLANEGESAAQGFVTIVVDQAAEDIQIDHPAKAKWADVYRAMVAVLDHINDRIAKQDGCPVRPLAKDTGALREEIARLTDERDEALAGPWPKWASDLLDILREYTGPCREDAEEGVDLPEEMRIWLDGYRDEMVKVAALSPDDGEGK